MDSFEHQALKIVLLINQPWGAFKNWLQQGNMLINCKFINRVVIKNSGIFEKY